MASHRLSYFSAMSAGEDNDIEQGFVHEREETDGRTPLDKTIDRIGMGWYQWTLLSLCGFGWMADNMWIQAIAIVLPRVQQHFSVRDSYIGTLSSAMFAGMMFGAVGWGTCSDLVGRTTAFNATLFLTSIFGVLASFATSFPWLCMSLFFLGSAVGGSMPTDGTLLLEHMPNGKQYLVTALSVFFSVGSVVAAVVGLLVIPSHSCPPAPVECDVATQNAGWQYLLSILGIITLTMFLARIVFFRLHESPRYLVHAGRPQEALESLQMISRFNGNELSLDLEDVQDVRPVTDGPVSQSPIKSNSDRLFTVADAPRGHPGPGETTRLSSGRTSLSSQGSQDGMRNSGDLERKSYSAVGESNVSLGGHSFHTPTIAQQGRRASTFSVHSYHSYESSHLEDDVKEPLMSEDEPHAGLHIHPHSEEPEDNDVPQARSRPRSRIYDRRRLSQRASVTSSIYEGRPRVYWMLPRWLRKPFWAWVDRVAMVLAPEWMRTTLLVWVAWFAMSLAYTMFNVFLPKLLEGRSSSFGSGEASQPKTLRDSMWDVVIYSIGGCPGAILGAWLVESPLGRRWSLAGSTFVTAFFCVVFVIVEQAWAVRASTMGISLSATAMYAVLYGWTPEIFGTKVRGSACGIASALSRIGGMIAPMLGGSLLAIDPSVPVYVSVVVFVLAGLCVLLITEEKSETGKSGARTFAH